MTGNDGNDSFVIDPSALSEVSLVDVIADVAQGDLLDLSDLLASLPVEALPPNSAPETSLADVGVAAAGTTVDLASLTSVGPGSVISILFDESNPSLSETVA
jgi:hypothetical protein